MGHVASATSTGGLTNKMDGRIGDTPIIGAGTYANDRTCGISCTGTGEEFMRHLVAYDVSCRIEYAHKTLEEAVHETVTTRLPEDCGGVIAVDARGNSTMKFNCGGMFRGSCNSSGVAFTGIWDDVEEFTVT